MNKHKLRNILALGLTLVVLATTGACASKSVQTPPVIDEFTVTSPQINSGESATLAWKVTDATVVSIDQGIGNVSAIGTKNISPTETTTYILTATNKYGTATEVLSINVLSVLPSEQQISSSEFDIYREVERCKKVLQETPINPVDENNDGIIDVDDLLLLAREANDHFDKKIRPLFDKAEIKTDEQGHITTPDPMGKLRDKLSIEEQRELAEAICKWYEFDAKIHETAVHGEK
jgi:hypothetical protein